MGVGRKVMRSIYQEREEIQELKREALRETLKRNLMINILHETMDSPSDMDEWKKQVTKILGNILKMEESVLQTIVEDAGYDIDLTQNEDSESTTNNGTIEEKEQEDEKQPAQDFAQAQQREGRNDTAVNSNAKVSLLGIGGVKLKGQKSQIVCAQDTPQPMQYDQEELAHVAMVATVTVDERAERDTGSGETKDDMEVSEEAVQENTDEDTSAAYQQNEEINQEMDTSQNDDAVAEAPSREDSINTEEEDVVATDQSRTRFGLSSSSEESDKQE
eukprot:scaffold82298_cov45-Cyclotella_meneghiniana.AAC.4